MNDKTGIPAENGFAGDGQAPGRTESDLPFHVHFPLEGDGGVEEKRGVHECSAAAAEDQAAFSVYGAVGAQGGIGFKQSPGDIAAFKRHFRVKDHIHSFQRGDSAPYDQRFIPAFQVEEFSFPDGEGVHDGVSVQKQAACPFPVEPDVGSVRGRQPGDFPAGRQDGFPLAVAPFSVGRGPVGIGQGVNPHVVHVHGRWAFVPAAVAVCGDVACPVFIPDF